MAKKRAKPVIQVYDYKWYPIGIFDAEECCDCGLTHKIKHRFKNGIISQNFVRDNKATDAVRKKNGIALSRKGR